jgi:hypothetical protein
MNFKKIPFSWMFFIIICIGYFLLFILNSANFFLSLKLFSEIFYKLIPTLFLIFFLLIFFNYFASRKFILSFIHKKGIKKWFFMILAGILSVGPIYMWYPLLSDLKSKGLSYGFISCFLYNRSIKLPLLPLFLIYFSWVYILILGLVIIFASIIQAVIIDKLMEK